MMAKMTEREEREGQQKEKCIHKLGKWSILGALLFVVGNGHRDSCEVTNGQESCKDTNYLRGWIR